MYFFVLIGSGVLMDAMILIGLAVSLALYLASRIACHRLLRIEGIRPLGRRAETRYFEQPRPRRLAWRVAGPLAPYLACAALFLVQIHLVGEVALGTRIDVRDDGPAARAGLRAGDRLVAVGGRRVEGWDDARAALGAPEAAGGVAVVVERDGHELTFQVVPDPQRRVGVTARTERSSVPLGPALARAAVFPVTSIAALVSSSATLATGRTRAELTGPVGIVRTTARDANQGSVPRLVFLLLLYPLSLAWPVAWLAELVLRPRRSHPG